MYIEFQNLEEFAEYLGFAFPEEIHIVAHVEGWYYTDFTGDYHLNVEAINDYLRRFGESGKMLSAEPFLYFQKAL